MTNSIQQATEALTAAVKENKAEGQRLEKALAALRNQGSASTRKTATATTSGRGRKRKQGGRRDQVLAEIQNNPGTSSGEIAKVLGIAPAAVSQQVTALKKEGLIAKDGRKLMPSGGVVEVAVEEEVAEEVVSAT